MEKSQLIEVLWGVAVADAVGNHLEFVGNVTEADVRKELLKPVLYPTDDTQMTLFNYESLFRGWGVNEAVLAWWRTQTYSKPKAPTGLEAFATLYRREAPGTTCCNSAMDLLSGAEVDNDSKGNGTVMRASPFAVMAHLQNWPKERAFLLAKQDALTTHKHPYAWQSSVLLVAILLRMFSGQGVKEAVVQAYTDTGITVLDGPDLLRMVFDREVYSKLLGRRSGWVAEEALALALGANLYAKDQSFLGICTQAYSGVATDSDTVGSIAGAIAAARGISAPENLKKRLYAEDAIVYITDHLKTL
jgi:ADP-ribosylglycohydrolase